MRYQSFDMGALEAVLGLLVGAEGAKVLQVTYEAFEKLRHDAWFEGYAAGVRDAQEDAKETEKDAYDAGYHDASLDVSDTATLAHDNGYEEGYADGFADAEEDHLAQAVAWLDGRPEVFDPFAGC